MQTVGFAARGRGFPTFESKPRAVGYSAILARSGQSALAPVADIIHSDYDAAMAGLKLLVVLATAMLPSTPYGPSDEAAWQRLLSARCPSHHIQSWMPEGNQVDLIDAFISSLPRAQQTRYAQRSVVRRTCASEVAGQSCEKIAELHGVRKLSLLAQFSDDACKRVICTEPAICGPIRHNRHSR